MLKDVAPGPAPAASKGAQKCTSGQFIFAAKPCVADSKTICRATFPTIARTCYRASCAGPYPAGASAHCRPLRMTWMIPLSTFRSSARPTPFSFGKRGLIRSICSSVSQNKCGVGKPPYHRESPRAAKGNLDYAKGSSSDFSVRSMNVCFREKAIRPRRLPQSLSARRGPVSSRRPPWSGPFDSSTHEVALPDFFPRTRPL